jgi:branched-chain amino acid transport system permease protein
MTNFLQLLFAGIALGSMYALVALGFVIIYKATGVINFAQGGLVVLGAYMVYDAHNTWGFPFWGAFAFGVAGCAVAGALVERVVLRRMVGQPVFAVIMVTIGLLYVIRVVVGSIWGFSLLNTHDPWGVRSVKLGSVAFADSDAWKIGLAAIVLLVFFLFFRYSRVGVAMRATALDQEAAVAQGISARVIFGLSWAIAGVVATLAGVMLSAGGGGVRPEIEFVALLAFPAIILGGLDSPLGAVVGGLVIGVTQVLTGGYQPAHASWLGSGFDSVMPYVVMIAILLVRPFGLFGTKEVRRI